MAFSGDYNDLENKPVIPSGQGQAAGTLNTDNTAAQAVNNSESLGGSVNLHKVAKTGDYNHLNNRPAIPTVRTMNGEQLTDSSLGDINIHDGFYFPNAAQDYDGNWYGAVVIGDQVWLAENLRTTHYADGTNIPINTAYPNNSDPFYWVGSNNEYYYNHPAAIQKTLLDGFHLPTKDEVETLRTYISKQVRYRLQNNEEVIAKSLAATSGWVVPNSYSNDVPGKNQSANNKTGFNLKPAGHAGYGNVMRVWFEGEVAAIWTATGSGENVYTLCVRNSLEWCQIGNQFYSAAFGLSIRCVSDLTPIQFRNWYVETYGSMQHHLPQAAPASNIVTYFFDGTDVTDRDGNTVTPQTIANSADAGKIVLLGYGGKCYTLGDYEMSGSPQEMVFVAANYSANHGDVASLDYLYYNSNNGWDSDRIYLQERLVASGAGQNIKTINLLSLLGSGNITLLPTHTLHTTTIATAGSTTTVTCAAGERAFHIVEVTAAAANCTLWIDILNGWDNTIYVYGSQNVNIIFKINGVQATTIFERHDQFAGLTAILSKAGAMKFVVEVVDNKAFVDVDAMDSLKPSV